MKKILILCTVIGLFGFDTYKNTSELERLIFESDPPQIEKALALVAQMKQEKDVREIEGVEKVLKRVTSKYREDTKVRRTHYVSKYGEIKFDLEDLLLILQITKADVHDTCDVYNFLIASEKSKIENGNLAREVEARYLNKDIGSYTAYILESLKVEENKALLHFLVNALSKSKDPMLDVSLIQIIEDNSLSHLQDFRRKLLGSLIWTKTIKAKEYVLNVKEETKDSLLSKNLEYLINVHVYGRNRFYLHHEGVSTKYYKEHMWRILQD